MTRIGELKFVLPGEWLSLDVRGNDEVVARRIHDLVHRTLGKNDALALLRRHTRAALRDAVADARVIKADYLHLAQSILDGIPISAALTVSRPGIALPISANRVTEQKTLLSIVSGSEPSVVEHSELAIVKTIDRVEAGPDPQGVDHLARLTANYWIEIPETGDLVVFSFSSSMPDLDDELLLLFDAIIGSVRREGPTADEPVQSAAS